MNVVILCLVALILVRLSYKKGVKDGRNKEIVRVANLMEESSKTRKSRTVQWILDALIYEREHLLPEKEYFYGIKRKPGKIGEDGNLVKVDFGKREE